MTLISVWVFEGDASAGRRIHSLAATGGAGLPIEDAAVVSWPPARRRPLAWQENLLVGARSLSGAFWGLLVGSLFLLPLSAELGAEHAGDNGPHQWTQDELSGLGIDAAFAAAVRSAVHPGTSALFLLSSDEAALQVDRAMPTTGVLIARARLSIAQTVRLHEAFDD